MELIIKTMTEEDKINEQKKEYYQANKEIIKEKQG